MNAFKDQVVIKKLVFKKVFQFLLLTLWCQFLTFPVYGIILIFKLCLITGSRVYKPKIHININCTACMGLGIVNKTYEMFICAK